MNTQRFDDHRDPLRQKRCVFAIVGIVLGVSLLFVSPPEVLRAGLGPGLRDILGPCMSFLWFIVGVVLLVFCIVNLVTALNLYRDQIHSLSEEALQRKTERKAEHSNDIEAKLRTLGQLKDQGLITTEEHDRKHADLLDKW